MISYKFIYTQDESKINNKLRLFQFHLEFLARCEYSQRDLFLSSLFMIRRILVFLAILFVSFFAWRWFDKAAADGFLQKMKNFSFKKQSSSYTTTITDPDGNTIVLDDEGSSTIGSTGLRDILSDTLADKTASGSEVNE